MTTYTSRTSLKSEDLYPLVDALGFALKLGPRGGNGVYPLIGEAEAAYNYEGVSVEYTLKVVESYLEPYAGQSTGVRVSIAGFLQLVLCYDHKRNRLEAYLIDASKLDADTVFHPTWSRLRLMHNLRNAVEAHFLWLEAAGEPLQWQATPNAKRWVKDYLIAREVHNLTADDGLALADALAFDLIDRETDDLHRKWKISTEHRRLEWMAGGTA